MIEVTQLVDDKRGDFVYKVELLKDHKYTIWFSADYYKKLTGGKMTEAELVKKSFEFLLDKEGPESILPEFELSLINHYFPEYEKTIKQTH